MHPAWVVDQWGRAWQCPPDRRSVERSSQGHEYSHQTLVSKNLDFKTSDSLTSQLGWFILYMQNDSVGNSMVVKHEHFSFNIKATIMLGYLAIKICHCFLS
jgi:hypothetical protein